MNTIEILQKILTEFLSEIQWKKSMRWGSYGCSWGRPLISIACMLNNNVIKFNFNHLASSNVIYLDGPYEEKEIKIKNASHYIDTLKK